jgi:hypothetical protein
MSNELIDLTLAAPAHDPSFPKPRGLLPVPQEIEEAVAGKEARIVWEHGFAIAPEARQRMIDEYALHYYPFQSFTATLAGLNMQRQEPCAEQLAVAHLSAA